MKKQELEDIIKVIGRKMWSLALCISDKQRLEIYHRMDKPQAGDLVMELSTSYRRRGVGKKAPAMNIGHYLGKKDSNVFIIKTLNGKFANWSNCKFITLIPEDKDQDWIDSTYDELESFNNRANKKCCL